MSDTSYADVYRETDFRKHPEKYRIGRGEQGVLIAQPYKSEILPYWKFATPDAAKASAEKIYDMFLNYGQQKDFVGMDMARKFMQMGFTRARRYANHSNGNKYAADGTINNQESDWQDSDKAKSAQIFKSYYDKARSDATYIQLKQSHQDQYK